MSEMIKIGEEGYNVIEFYTNFLHDLRAELTIIGGYASIISEESENSEIKANAELISDSYKKMAEAINNVNDLIRIESGVTKFKKEDIDLKKIISDILLENAKLLEEKQLVVEFNPDSEQIWITSDPEGIQKAFTHIIDASIGFCPMGSRIKINIMRGEKIWKGYLQDNGPGIPVEDVPNLFKPFQNIQSLSYTGQSRIGLKLLIAKEILGHLDGKLWAESQPNKGIKLNFELPVKKEIEKKRVLIIEDNLTIAKMWEAKLKKTYTVDIAPNGPEGLKKAQEHHPHIVILDILMPGMDGFEVCKQLKANPELVNVPVIFLSNLLQEHLKEKAKAAGAVDIITKSSVSPSDLAAKIEEILAKYHTDTGE
ncbi:MAG: hybrid sensor histidine kinase/response regulator [Armatimonadota bacterium]